MGKRLLSFFTAVLFVILSAGCGISGRDKANDKQNTNNHRKIIAGSEHRKKFICFRWVRDGLSK